MKREILYRSTGHTLAKREGSLPSRNMATGGIWRKIGD